MIRIQDWLLWREFLSSPDAIIPVSLAASSRQPHSGLHCKPYYHNQDSSFKEISEAKAKNLWLLPYNAFGQFLHTKLKTHLKTLQHSQVPVTPVHQTQTSDTDWAHSITTSLMPGLAGLSIYFSLTFPSSPQHTAGSPAP